MRYSITRLIVAGAISAGIAGVALAYPRWVMALGLDLWKLPDMNRQIVINLIFNEQLDRQVRAATNRLAVKQSIADELYDGRLTLRKAAECFRNLNRANPKFAEHVRILHPNCSDDECQYWNVIDCVANSGGRYPNEDRFVARLNAEFQALKDREELQLGN